MNDNAKILTLRIVTQEQQLLEVEVKSVTVMTEAGEVTILPGHVPLFSVLSTGELHYFTADGKQDFLAVAGGFLDVSPDGVVTVLANHARPAHEINEAEAEEARRRAEELMHEKQSGVEFQKAQYELMKSLAELKVARKKRGI